eukprot:TRINITY_DN873_c0_g1_i2.p1 TRINITY_DN873_c0_g1~~TRINITY_DN873_c0_g1_i2.p1  ORF type:complete len:394 (+),score=90.30 TRINITY_DN873_c0_g1_i2:45-1226(+)
MSSYYSGEGDVIKRGEIEYIGNTDWVMGVAVSQDLICSVGYDKTARVYCRNGKQLRCLEHPEAVLSVAQFTIKDEHQIVTGDTKGVLRIWNRNEEPKILDLEKLSCISTWDGCIYAAGGKLIHIIDLNGNKVGELSPGNAIGTINAMVIEADVMYVGGDGTALRSHCLTTGARRTFKGSPSSTMSLAVSKSVLVAGGYDGIIRLWNLISGQQVMQFRGHTQRVNGLVFKGLELWSGSGDGSIRCWEANTGICTQILEAGSPVLDLQIDEAGDMLYSGTACGTLRSWVINNWATSSESDHVTCGLACHKIVEQKLTTAQQIYGQQLDSLNTSFLQKLDALQSEKDGVMNENRVLLDMVKALRLENERLKNGVFTAAAAETTAADEKTADDVPDS